jgi:aspartate/methionine/tyrosine aminotransferase
LPAGAFTRFADRLQAETAAGTLVPLHIGDTYLDASSLLAGAELTRPELHRYGPVPGVPELRRLVAERLLPGLGRDLPDAGVVITAGATGGLSVALAPICDPGDEIIVVTPSWPLIFGIIASHDGKSIEVPISPDGWPDDAEDFAARLLAAVTPRTAAIYLSDPNNPVGYVLPEAHRRAVAQVAESAGLWLVHDAVYADLRWAGTQPSFAGLIDDARLLTVGSFSKTHAIAGHRIGFVAAPVSLATLIGRFLMYHSYHPSIAGQALALAAVDEPGLAARVRDSYAAGAGLAQRHLQLAHPPEAGGFAFIDLRGVRGTPDEFLSRCLDAHVALAPGASFGRDFAAFARLCYTCVSPSTLEPALVAVSRALRL